MRISFRLKEKKNVYDEDESEMKKERLIATRMMKSLTSKRKAKDSKERFKGR